MLKSSLQIVQTSSPQADGLVDPSRTSRGKLRRYANALLSVIRGGAHVATVYRDTLAGGQTWTLSSASGDVDAVINGVTVTVTTAVSDINTAGLMATAINASSNALVLYFAEADNRSGTVALSSCAVGGTVFIGSYKLIAVAKASSHRGEFEVSGDDTADGGTLAAAINTMPGLQDLVYAVNSSGTVTIYSRRQSTPLRDLTISGTAGTNTTTAATATVFISAIRKGLPGNAITIAASGTGASAGGARMTGGTTTVETL